MIIPIFNYKLTVVIFDKWEELERFLPKEEMEQEAKAITINQYGASLVAINSKRGSSIIHEAEHIKNELMMYEYLKKKGMGGMNEHEFMDKFKNFMTKYRRNSMRHGSEGDFMPMGDFYMRRHGRPDEFMDMFDSRGDRFSDRFNESGMGGNDMDRMMRYMRNSMRDSMSGEHFTESEAKYLVADMYHTENGRKYSGEKFDMHKAKEICERYRGILPTSVTAADVYVAINSQYHDYAELFKSWFGDGIEQKIVESAIVFWFKDADCKAENKVVEYLGEY